MSDLKEIYHWIEKQKKKQKIIVKKKHIFNLKLWKSEKQKIFHISKNFFSIVGLRVTSNFYKKKTWDQPLIYQNENGILGIIRRLKNNNPEYLMQAKVEPGNVNKLQISPTVQATKSNYTGVHGGKKIKFLNFFLNKNNFIVKSKQTEQGFRYLFKKNTNILINIKGKIAFSNNHKWISKKKLILMVKNKNVLNMDTLSVFSCAIKKNSFDEPLYTIKTINLWLKGLKKKYYINIKKIKLSHMRDWVVAKKNIFHKTKNFFTIIGVRVATKAREVSFWDQPLIMNKNISFAGFLVKKINFTTHYLVRFSLKPGLKKECLSCTVNTSDVYNYKKNKNLTVFSKFILKNFFLSNKKNNVKYDTIQSDEGGRFYQSQIRNMIIKIDNNQNISFDKGYKWISQNQMIYLIDKGLLDIEARLLFSCYNFDKII
jgi:oxidase EvaA